MVELPYITHSRCRMPSNPLAHLGNSPIKAESWRELCRIVRHLGSEMKLLCCAIESEWASPQMPIYLLFALFILTFVMTGCSSETTTSHAPVGTGLYGGESVGAGGH